MDEYKRKIAEKSLFKGRIIEVISNTMEYCKNDKIGHYEAEIARRSPGVRILIVNENQNKILITKELRPELQNWDYRLPGGKVYDKLDHYLEHKDNEEISLKFIEDAVVNEAEEEAGIIVEDKKFLHKSTAGASIAWDLYYYIVTDFSVSTQKTEDGEIIHVEWRSFDEVIEMCLNGSIKEDRSVAVLLRYLLKQKTNN